LKTDLTADVFKTIHVDIIKNKNSISETLGKHHFHESHRLGSTHQGVVGGGGGEWCAATGGNLEGESNKILKVEDEQKEIK
jgi:hypothetical protein